MAMALSGTMRCGMYRKIQLYGFLSLLLTGLSRKPSLLTHKSPVLAPGENLILKCSSEISYDRFALFKKGEGGLTQVSAHQSQDGHFHANFTLGSVNSSIGGQYRCLGVHSSSSVWSAPSDPLDILITGEDFSAGSAGRRPGIHHEDDEHLAED